MQIHVIHEGESLYSISQLYGTTTAEIAAANQTILSETLVIGQVLVIPIVGMYHTVQPGDTLYGIATRNGLTPERLAEVNGINIDDPIFPEQRIYIPPTPKTAIESNAYADTFADQLTDPVIASAADHAPLLTYIAPFSTRVQADGSLVPLDIMRLESTVTGSGASFMMAVTNLQDGVFSDTLAASILNDPAVQDTLLNNIIDIAHQDGYRDVHFDFEYVRPADREAYNAFLRKASVRLHETGLMMSTALAPKLGPDQEGAWYSAHDYRVHGEVADFVVIMTYEWGYSAGPPLPVSPIGPVSDVLNYALTEIPAEKILMGQNLYGYDWTLPYVQGGDYAVAISPQRAIRLARDYGANIQYDEVAQAPFFEYWDENSRQHMVWFEDARSINAKFDLLKSLNLRGISFWKLGLDFPQNWLLLDERFNIIKISRS